MGKRCSVKSCDTSVGRFYAFPNYSRNVERCQQWLMATGNISLLELPKEKLRNRYICKKHFSEQSLFLKKLTSEAVPTLHLPEPMELLKTYLECEDIDLTEVENPSDLVVPDYESSWDFWTNDSESESIPQFECFFGLRIKMELSESEMNAQAVENFREYLRIPSMHPNINYDDCISFILKQGESLQLPVKVLEVSPGKPVAIITWRGTQPEEDSILLNGHMDVVPVFPEEWKYPPFGAHMDENGDIYARGSQDCKCVSIQQLEAIRRLKSRGVRLDRTVHISFVPEEEIGGHQGMKAFTETPDFKLLKVGFALDEGSASPNDEFSLTYGERTLFRIWVHCTGTTGHGSLLPDDTSGEKLFVVLDRFMKFRAAEKEKLKNPGVRIGNVTSVNLTMLEGGVQINVIPKEFSAGFDIRLAADMTPEKFEQMVQEWCKEAGEGVYFTTEIKEPFVENTKLDDSNNFWVSFKNACDNLNIKLDPMIRLGASDSRFLRAMGIPTFGFTPINQTPLRFHGNNEFLNKDVFLRGITIFEKIIKEIATV